MVNRLDSVIAASVGEFRMDSTRIFETMTELGTQLQATWAGWSIERSASASDKPARMIHAAQQLKAAGRMDEAKSLLEKVCELDPEHQEAWEALELIYASQGEYDELLEMRHVWVDHAGGDEEAVARLEERMSEDGADGYWEWRLEELKGRAAEGQPVSPVYMAAAYAGLGDRDEALDMLQNAVRSRDRRLTSVRTDAIWDPLRSDPRFVSLMNRMRGSSVRAVRRPGL
jgi:tetratricopeptide (TPR) repeat protein